MLPPVEIARVRALAAQGTGPTAIARALGRPLSTIQRTYRQAQRDGLAPCRPSTRGPTWTRVETMRLLDMIEQGHSYDAIAQTLRRSRTAIAIKAKRLGTRITTTRATLSARDVAHLLGLGCAKTVVRWIRRRWLRARNAGQPSRPLWRVPWEALTTFLETPTYWPYWQPARMTDWALRDWAQELRQGREERYLTQHEVAAHYCVVPETVGAWIDKGWLPVLRWGNRRVPASALATFVPPCWGGIPDPPDWPRANWQDVGQIGGVRFRRHTA